MFSTPAHKQVDPSKLPAQRVNQVGASLAWNGPDANRLNANGVAAASAACAANRDGAERGRTDVGVVSCVEVPPAAPDADAADSWHAAAQATVDAVNASTSLAANVAKAQKATRDHANDHLAGPRPLHVIAAEICADWKKVNYAAKPYLFAMRELNGARDAYGSDSAQSVIAYFLSNARSWTGPVAKRVKAELKAMLPR